MEHLILSPPKILWIRVNASMNPLASATFEFTKNNDLLIPIASMYCFYVKQINECWEKKHKIKNSITIENILTNNFLQSARLKAELWHIWQIDECMLERTQRIAKYPFLETAWHNWESYLRRKIAHLENTTKIHEYSQL